MREKIEIEEMVSKVIPWLEASTSDVPGMTYEEGVDAALRWALGDCDDEPIENEYQGDDDGS